MILIFIRPGKNLIIHDCPGEFKSIRVSMQSSSGTYKITKTLTDDSITEYNITDGRHIMDFLWHQYQYGLTPKACEFFNGLLGFIPFYKWEGEKSVHIPHVPLNDITSYRKPIKFVNILKYQIPKGLVKHMKLVNNLMESTGDLSGLAFPEHIEPYVPEALQKLAEMESHDFTLEDMAVYDFLEMLDVINNDNSVFYHGGKMLYNTAVNRLNAGYIEQCDGIFYEFDIPEDTPHDHPLLTDTIVEHSGLYRKMVSKHEKISGAMYRAMKLHMTRSGYV